MMIVVVPYIPILSTFILGLPANELFSMVEL